uniref:Uncharacterized protein n=1 Tax=Cladonia uncialis subsp. uncialis TaxID=180999 RepID=A0A2K9YD73_CLAUC|nr:hypothetical protein [Cladonia uncialis subsp. uncialis]
MARYIDHKNFETPPPADFSQELVASLTKLVTGFPPRSNYCKHDLHGLYSGPTSIAYLFLALSKSSPELVIAHRSPDYWCRRYLYDSRPGVPVTPSRCGVANETLAHLAVGAAAEQSGKLVDLFLGFVPAVLAEDEDKESNEWLYGRAGTLYLLRLMRTYNPLNPKVDEAITAIIEKILQEGPPWFWHGKEYLGAVHGSIGIITQIILSEPKRAMQLKGLVEKLIAAQNPVTGNWASSNESGRDHLVQFCHGAPGFVISLLAVRQYFTQDSQLLEEIDKAIEIGRDCIYQQGLLAKEPCLCHGATGNAVALDGERQERLMRWCQRDVVEKGLNSGVFQKSDDEWGLFCGEAGRAWGCMLAEGLEEAMIGYSDI